MTKYIIELELEELPKQDHKIPLGMELYKAVANLMDCKSFTIYQVQQIESYNPSNQETIEATESFVDGYNAGEKIFEGEKK